MTFEAMVAADPAARRALQYGGERPNEDFHAFIERISNQRTGTEADVLGKIIIILSAIGIVACFWKRKKL